MYTNNDYFLRILKKYNISNNVFLFSMHVWIGFWSHSFGKYQYLLLLKCSNWKNMQFYITWLPWNINMIWDSATVPCVVGRTWYSTYRHMTIKYMRGEFCVNDELSSLMLYILSLFGGNIKAPRQYFFLIHVVFSRNTTYIYINSCFFFFCSHIIYVTVLHNTAYWLVYSALFFIDILVILSITITIYIAKSQIHSYNIINYFQCIIN